MDEATKKEIRTLEGIVDRWCESYLKMVDHTPGWEFLIKQLNEEITQWIMPYVDRLRECGFLEPMDIASFFGFCASRMEQFEKDLKSKQKKEGFNYFLQRIKDESGNVS